MRSCASDAPATAPRGVRGKTPRQALTSVAVVCGARHDVGAIDAVVEMIDAFVDPAPRWTVISASGRAPPGLLRLLERIAANDPEEMDEPTKQLLFTRGLTPAVRRGDLPAVQWFVEQYHPAGKVQQAVVEAAKFGQVDILRWLAEKHASRLVWSHRELEFAAERNHLATVKWLFESSGQFGGNDADHLLRLFHHAVRHDNLGMLEWIDDQCQQRGVCIESKQAEAALLLTARKGHRAVMEYLSEHFDCDYTRPCLDAAIRESQLEIAQCIRSRAGICRTHASHLSTPAARGHTELITWALRNLELENRQDLGWVTAFAAAAGRADVVQVFQDHPNGPCTVKTLNSPPRNCHLEMVM